MLLEQLFAVLTMKMRVGNLMKVTAAAAVAVAVAVGFELTHLSAVIQTSTLSVVVPRLL